MAKARGPEMRGGCRREVGHGGDRLVGRRLAGAEHPDGLLLAVPRALGADDDDRAAGIGDEAAVEEVERVGDPARGEHVVDGDRVAHHRLRVEGRPLAGGDGDLGELLVRGAVLVHVAHAGHGVVRGRAADVVGHLELGGGVPRVERGACGAAAAAAGGAALAVGDEGDVDEAGGDGGGGVLDVDDEGGAADGGAVGVGGLDAEVFGELEGGRPAGEPALKTPSTSDLSMPASSRALRAASAWSWRVDLWGTMPISSDSSAPTMATFLKRAAFL